MAKTRNQNLTVTDTVSLQLVTYNSNNLANVQSIEKVEIYKLDPAECSDCNKDGRILVDTITDINEESTGVYNIQLAMSSPKYTIGKYIDVWSVIYRENEEVATSENHFEVYSDLWYTTTQPAVYGFSFQFQPNRIRKGSIKWLVVKVIPNVPRSTDLERYYTNLAISSDLEMSMEQICSPCGDNCNDLILEDEPLTVRDKVFGFFKIDTTEDGLDLDIGLYHIWFTLRYAGNIDISEKMNLEIY